MPKIVANREGVPTAWRVEWRRGDQNERMNSPDTSLIVPLASLDRTRLALAGGKAANLGELIRAGFPVPDGVCLTTEGYERAVEEAGLASEIARLGSNPGASEREIAAAIGERLRTAPVPQRVRAALDASLEALTRSGAAAVAVRSSATAEDLAEASFAGQLETYLNVVGSDALAEAVRCCWASLWTERAVAYRAANGVNHSTVRMAVVVQRMVESTVSGVLFTADPVSGRRGRAVIDAARGLGEAIVSGAVNPDHFAVDVAADEIRERTVGRATMVVRGAAGGGTERVSLPAETSEPVLRDEEIRQLAALGVRLEHHFGQPQDIEFALDAKRRVWLTQTRAITSLYPLPDTAPEAPELRVYFSANVAQGFLAPFTPMGLQGMRLIGSGIARVIGRPPRDRVQGPEFFAASGERLFFDITPLVRDRFGRRGFLGITNQMEARTNAALRELLAAEPRLALTQQPFWRSALRFARVLAHARVPPRILRALVAPEHARRAADKVTSRALAVADVPEGAGPGVRLDAFERLLAEGVPRVAPAVLPLAAAGAVAYAVANRLLGELATNEERQIVRRALPNNPTMEMDLALWELSRRARADPDTRQVLAESAEDLARRYAAQTLPQRLQADLVQFLATYGYRGVGEIDLGVPRWSDDPTHVLAILATYAGQPDDERAPDAQFRRARADAEAMVKELSRRAATRGRIRGVVVRAALHKTRALFGMREVPKASFVRVLTRARALLRSAGTQLAESGTIDAPDDVFFLTLPDARRAAAGDDVRSIVRGRRAVYERELRRRHVPRLLLSDGTEPTPSLPEDALLRGTPASPGTVTAPARVLLVPNGATLEPGEILVAPSTDPGWTPLFLTAGGLVMEMGGAMSHGAIVAREYGIPAVVGVPDATERIATGQAVTVDGSAGVVQLP
jgi:phosphohistidine swiveling domain-containing protein